MSFSPKASQPFEPLVDHNLRTSRQRTLPQVGVSGQARLENAVVAVIGAGGLGAPVIQYLAAAGVGTIHVFDDDHVELSNLNRQVIHSAHEPGVPKVDNAVATAARIAPEVRVVGHQVRLTPANVTQKLAHIVKDTGLDVIVDGSDSFETRFTIHQGACELELPVVFGAVMQWSAQVTMFWSAPPVGHPVVLTDVFEDTDAVRGTPGCAETGIMGAVTGMVGSLLATETIKFILGVGASLLGRMLVLDTLASTTREVPLVGAQNIDTEAPADEPLPSKKHVPVSALGPDDVPTGVRWVDVRRAEETQLAPGPTTALHIPLDEVLQVASGHTGHPAIGSSADTTPIFVFCASGMRSVTAARHLRRLGYQVAGYLDGGISAHPHLSTPQQPSNLTSATGEVISEKTREE